MTVVFFEAPHRILGTLQTLKDIIGGDRRICVGRELTKAHEELVIGPIQAVLQKIRKPLGEYTVVIDVGQQTNVAASQSVSDDVVLAEFCDLTKNHAATRRQALSSLARRFNKTPNELYAAIERAKNRSHD
jgi:16S rRNA (cytidine1402-2'-O)-methyltransferase